MEQLQKTIYCKSNGRNERRHVTPTCQEVSRYHYSTEHETALFLANNYSGFGLPLQFLVFCATTQCAYQADYCV